MILNQSYGIYLDDNDELKVVTYENNKKILYFPSALGLEILGKKPSLKEFKLVKSLKNLGAWKTQLIYVFTNNTDFHPNFLKLEAKDFKLPTCKPLKINKHYTHKPYSLSLSANLEITSINMQDFCYIFTKTKHHVVLPFKFFPDEIIKIWVNNSS